MGRALLLVALLAACSTRAPATATQSGPDDLAWLSELVRRMGDEGAERAQVVAYLGRAIDSRTTGSGGEEVRVAPFSAYLHGVTVSEPWPEGELKTLRAEASFAPGKRPSRDAIADVLGELQSAGARAGSGPAGPVGVSADTLVATRNMRVRDVRILFDVALEDRLTPGA